MSSPLSMDSRRDFLKKATLLGAGYAWAGGVPASIQRALAIDPPQGTTYRDAEHVVILMQENRSFDHCYGSLRGVRGFHDPRAVALPNSNPVWLQSNDLGETYAPFRLDLRDSKITWMGSLPHSWSDQVDARHGGRHDRWLQAKPSGHKEYSSMPLTLGYFTRDDIPFYYALADAFTVCDQNFCSSLTGTTPNRLYLWTGTIRSEPKADAKANVWNSDVDYGDEAHWKTFPERLEQAGISWGIYQNEISLESGLSREQDGWLANFTDNPIEWFSQYRVRFSPSYRAHLPRLERQLTEALAKLDGAGPLSDSELKKRASLRAKLEKVRSDQAQYNDKTWAALDRRSQNLHNKAFITNSKDPHYRELTSLEYRDGGTNRRMEVPKGDVLYQFRSDVKEGRLPAVSWLVAPEQFSDHPGAPWYGAWYLSEVLDILTQNPKVWQKTIFILCYDENDGFFDHVPPFVPPAPGRPETGKVSDTIDTAVEMGPPSSSGSPQPIGLGFRVPLVIASPWSRGGYVCSEVYDHTSILQFLEHWLTLKTGKPVEESNISRWRRTVCGDLTSVFRPHQGDSPSPLQPVAQGPFFQSIHQAQFKPIPAGYRKLSGEDVSRARRETTKPEWFPKQEPGTRPSCALPYDLRVDAQYSPEGHCLVARMVAAQTLFGEQAQGAPFHTYAPNKARRTKQETVFETGLTWDFAVEAGDSMDYTWPLSLFENETYHLRFHGPNGFYREFKGNHRDPRIHVAFVPTGKGKWQAELQCSNVSNETLEVIVEDRSYGQPTLKISLPATKAGNSPGITLMDLEKTKGWYDFQIRVAHRPGYARHYAGRLEVGLDSISDPAMG